MDYREFPLRPHGTPWFGLSTESGRLAVNPSQMEDCTNVLIAEADTLSKRKGLVRALDEQFNGPICGLFKYTDHCGTEHLLVADGTAVNIRQPFVVPTFTQADCYPFDSFAAAEVSDVNWRNRDRYETLGDALVLRTTTPIDADTVESAIEGALRWFKSSCSPSYQIRTQHTFVSGLDGQRLCLIVRGNTNLSSGALLLGLLETSSGGVLLRLVARSATGSLATLLSTPMAVPGSGFLSLSYTQATRVLAATYTPTTGGSTTFSAPPLTELQDADLGLTSAVGLSQVSGSIDQGLAVQVVDGGSV